MEMSQKKPKKRASRGAIQMLSGALAATFFLFVTVCASAQDTRDVQEPKIPAVCARLTAKLLAGREPLAEDRKGAPDTERVKDTKRIQSAIDGCKQGMAVELAVEPGHNAFLSGPLELKPGVTLLVDGGATLFATRNPREYDLGRESCGRVDDDGHGCKPLIHVNHAPHAAVMGAGVIDGQGGQLLTERNVGWWNLAHQAKVQDKKQNCPRLIAVDSSDDFVLYGITLRNSPNYHVIVSRTDGFTAWGVKIDSPATARNTDGIDPSSSSNVTIAYSWIRAGDDNVAIKAGKNGPATHMTILRNHFYSGHGMSIGSETEGGVSAIRVTDLTIDGADNGLRIKSDVSRGGLVRDVVYQDVCIRDVKNPIILDPFYSKTPGSLAPVYQDIKLRNTHVTGGGKITLLGLDAQHLLGVQLDGVAVDSPSDVRAAHARFVFGPGSVNLAPAGDDVQTASTSAGEKGEAPNCNGRFIAFPEAANMALQTAVATPSDNASSPASVTVAADGSGDYKSVQQGIDVLSAKGGTVRIKPGTYREVVRVSKPHVRMEGLGGDAAKVVIVYRNSAAITGSTFTSATVSITADDFSASGLTFQNDYGSNHQQHGVPDARGFRVTGQEAQGSQAVALSVTGDRATFRNVRFLGAQDTLYAGGRSCRSDSGPCAPARQYFQDCYIEGHVDFIFGDSMAVFDHCEIHAIAHAEVYLTAQSKRYPEQESGYVFDHCRITADAGVQRVFLGRPWRWYATVVFLNSELDAKVSPSGWKEWHAGQTDRLLTAFYAEYKSSGQGAAPTLREPHSRQLTDAEAEKYKATNFLAGRDGWNPIKP